MAGGVILLEPKVPERKRKRLFAECVTHLVSELRCVRCDESSRDEADLPEELSSPAPTQHARQPIFLRVSARTTSIHSDGSFVALKCFGAFKRGLLEGSRLEGNEGHGGG